MRVLVVSVHDLWLIYSIGIGIGIKVCMYI